MAVLEVEHTAAQLSAATLPVEILTAASPAV